jgi:hypothetical protein
VVRTISVLSENVIWSPVLGVISKTWVDLVHTWLVLSRLSVLLEMFWGAWGHSENFCSDALVSVFIWHSHHLSGSSDLLDGIFFDFNTCLLENRHLCFLFLII